MHFANLGEESHALLDDAQFEIFDSLSLAIGPISASRRWYSTDWLSSTLGIRWPCIGDRCALSLSNTDGQHEATLEGWTPSASPWLSFRAHQSSSLALQVYCAHQLAARCTANATFEGDSADQNDVAASLCCTFFDPGEVFGSLVGRIEALHGGVEYRPFAEAPVRASGEIHLEHARATLKFNGSTTNPAAVSVLLTGKPLEQISPYLTRLAVSTDGQRASAGAQLELSESCSVRAKCGSDDSVGKVLATVHLTPSVSIGTVC
jgi:hypothetical protein